jgi:hypothetical protein
MLFANSPAGGQKQQFEVLPWQPGSQDTEKYPQSLVVRPHFASLYASPIVDFFFYNCVSSLGPLSLNTID